jgi:Na+/H+ antiporter NhaC
MGGTIGYTLILESLGYFVSTLLYGLVTVSLFGSSEEEGSFRPFKTMLSWAAVAVMITAVVYLLFGVAFGFRLP